MSEEKREIMDGAAEKAAVDSAEGRTGEGRNRRARRRKVSYLTLNKIDYIDYKDINLLKRFISADRGKISGSRQTGHNARQQRQVTIAIKRAREMALLPFVLLDTSDDRSRREGREGRENREPRQYEPRN